MPGPCCNYLLKEFLGDLSDSQDFWVLFKNIEDAPANYHLFTNLISYDCEFIKAVSGDVTSAALTGDTQLFRIEDIAIITADTVAS